MDTGVCMLLRLTSRLVVTLMPLLFTLTAASGVAGAQEIPDPAQSTVPSVVTVGPNGECCFDIIVRDSNGNPLSGSIVTISFDDCSVQFCATQAPGVIVVGNSVQGTTNALGLAHLCICACFPASPCTATISADAVVLGSGIPAEACGSCSCPGNVISNGDFASGVTYGSMPTGAVDDWSFLTASPQVIPGCFDAASIQMWGNQGTGESIQQHLVAPGIQKGRTYRVTLHYRWIDLSPNRPDYVRLRLGAWASAPAGYPPAVGGYDLIGITPNTSSTSCVAYTFPDWTAPNDASWITVNPENNSTAIVADSTSWGIIDDICITELPCAVVSNGDFASGVTYGSMPAGAVADWSLLTNSPQVIPGCTDAASIQMWGNQVAGESIQQHLVAPGIEQGRTYRVTLRYRWIDLSPNRPDYVRLRLAAWGSAPAGYPPAIGGYDLIGITPNTSSTSCVAYTFPDWTAPSDASWITVNPENNSSVNSADSTSWGIIDDICFAEVPMTTAVGPASRRGSMLLTSFPNPFGIESTVRFSVTSREHVVLEVFDISGRRVRTVVDRTLEPGVYENYRWDGRDGTGRSADAGVYFYRLQTQSGLTESRRLVLIR